MAQKKKHYYIEYSWLMANGCVNDENRVEVTAERYSGELAAILGMQSTIRVARYTKLGAKGELVLEDEYYPHGRYSVMNGIVKFLEQ